MITSDYAIFTDNRDMIEKAIREDTSIILEGEEKEKMRSAAEKFIRSVEQKIKEDDNQSSIIAKRGLANIGLLTLSGLVFAAGAGLTSTALAVVGALAVVVSSIRLAVQDSKDKKLEKEYTDVFLEMHEKLTKIIKRMKPGPLRERAEKLAGKLQERLHIDDEYDSDGNPITESLLFLK
jgi:Flp pilus assembly protein TadB